MNLPILQYTAEQGDEQLLKHQMSDDEEGLFTELDEASAAVESDDLDEVYQVIVPLGAAHGLSPNQTIAFWTRSTFRLFEPPEFSPAEPGDEASPGVPGEGASPAAPGDKSSPAEPLDEYSMEFNDLMFSALDHGFESIKDGKGPLIPFAMVHTTGGERRLQRFVTERIEEGVEQAKRYVDEHRADFAMYAVAWDGHITIDGCKWDAVLVEAGTAESEDGRELYQRYQLKKGLFRKRNVAVGSPTVVGKAPSRIHRIPEPHTSKPRSVLPK